jgi:hypothetical protein
MTLILSGTDGLSDVDGSAATPAIRGTDANTGIFFPAADTIAFSEGGVESMRIDSAGNFGLGVTPSAWRSTFKAMEIGRVGNSIFGGVSGSSLEVTSNVYLDTSSTYRYANTGAATDYYQQGGNHIWYNAPSGTAGNTISFTQAMTLDASGRLGIGTSSPAHVLDVSKSANESLVRINGSSSRAYFQSNTSSFDIVSETSVGGPNALYLRASGGGGLFIDSSGNLLVGTTSSSSNSGPSIVQSVQSGNETYIRVNHNSAASSGGWFMGFSYNGTAIGSITQNGTTATAYNTSSDYRLKNTIAPMTGALAKVAALKPCTYKWNADGSDGEGFIAHELAEVCPQAVTGEKDAVNEDGNPVYQGIDTSFLVATLTAALQEAHGLIKDLQVRVNALEAK